VSPATPEAPVLRRTRRRLIAWSAGSTLVVLLVLGAAIYLAASSSLAAAGTAQLRARFAGLSFTAPSLQRATIASRQLVGVTSDPSQPGVVIGGDLSGTIAILAAPPEEITRALPAGGGPAAGTTVARPASGVGGGFDAVVPDVLTPNDELVEQAMAADGEPVVHETTMGTTPIRILLGTVPGSGVVGAPPAMAIVIGDRTAELETLRTLLLVLLVGGLAVLAASVALGYVYAGRALVPIRESFRRQREFAADASHELRTPLAITRAALAELRRGRDDPATVDRALDDLDAGTTRLETLVADLLLLARADADAVAVQLADADLALAAAEAAEGLEAVAAGRGLRLVLDLEPAPVAGDEARLRQLATILVDNAIRHSPAGGRVTVTARPGATLVVEDEGPGIATEHLEAVFDRFWRAPDAPAGGTGLGLAIARWVAEQHGGSIRAEQRPGQSGARFVVRVPGA
jgi:signal transduction histidine kinase